MKTKEIMLTVLIILTACNLSYDYIMIGNANTTDEDYAFLVILWLPLVTMWLAQFTSIGVETANDREIKQEREAYIDLRKD